MRRSKRNERARPKLVDDFKPSQYQQAIFDFVKHGTGNAIIQAVAGSGKTTTIVKALRHTDGDVLFCAFNKAIVTELKKKTPAHVRVKTLHSIGYGIIRLNLDGNRKIDIDSEKMRKVIRQILDDEPLMKLHNAKPKATATLLGKLINLTQACLRRGAPADLEWISEHYGIELNGFSLINLSSWVTKAIRESTRRAELGQIDYNDMIYLPALRLGNGWRSFKQDWIFVDEAQDLSKAQRRIVEQLLSKKGRLIAVGDRNQAIYGFRGADVDSMSLLREHFNCKELPLSICYRCPKTHVAMAKTLVDQIEASPTAKEGSISYIMREQLAEAANEDDLVMCRTNAPLVKAALGVITLGKKAVIKGKDIGSGLVKLVQKMGCPLRVSNLLRMLDQYVEAEALRLREQEKDALAATLVDRKECIQILAEGVTRTKDLERKIERVFSDNLKGVIFSSVHRAKGLEADRTFILEFDKMPLHWKNQRDWEHEQELNIKYVALTRAKKEMYLVQEEREHENEQEVVKEVEKKKIEEKNKSTVTSDVEWLFTCPCCNKLNRITFDEKGRPIVEVLGNEKEHA